jgi:hypothetical protein
MDRNAARRLLQSAEPKAMVEVVQLTDSQGSMPHGQLLVFDWWSTNSGSIEHGGRGDILMGQESLGVVGLFFSLIFVFSKHLGLHALFVT